MLIQTDARRHAFSRIERPPTAGATLELTIDEYLQHIAERELQAGVAENRAAGGTRRDHGSAHRRDPRDGELRRRSIPNAYRAGRDGARRNRAIQDLYEPGSTFKIVTASAALEEKVDPSRRPDRTSAAARSASDPASIHDTHDYGVLSFTDVIVKSSNVGAIKVGLKLGAERLGAYVKRFGFGRPSSPRLPRREPRASSGTRRS